MFLSSQNFSKIRRKYQPKRHPKSPEHLHKIPKTSKKNEIEIQVVV